MKLEIELVPSPCWYSNMRNAMPRSKWDKLRKGIYLQYEHRCGICRVSPQQIQCHELWKYDDENHIQILEGFIALCPICHHVKHIGMADVLASEGKLDYNAVVAHFCKVNECSEEDFEQAKKQAFDQWRERSKHLWITDLGKYAHLVDEKA